MKVSLNWLKRFVALEVSAEEIAEVFPKIGMEVDSIEYKGFAANDHVVMGKIIAYEQHPNADRLRVCRVDVGDGTLRQIVCGAKNFKGGDCVPVALPGAVLPGNVKIKKSKLRGIESEGMMCSSRELGLGCDHEGLLILEQKWPLGTKISDIFNDCDVIYDLELTANRSDALYHYGIARELAAWYDSPLKPIEFPDLSKVGVQRESAPIEVWIESENCECYGALVLENITIKESVEWIRRDLEAVGVSVVNNIVDLTNWILLAYGQPLHAFDREKVGNKIVVRQANEGETLATLDGKTHTLTKEALLICNEEKPIALAGIMGGEDTKVTPETHSIILEGACFCADNIRKVSRKLGLLTDSSYRYARRVDAAQTKHYLELTASLLHELYGAQILLPEVFVEKEAIVENREIVLEPQFIRDSFGFQISDVEIEQLLRRLRYEIKARADGQFIVQVPSYRWDVTRPVDLVEECLRVYGVDKLPETKVQVTATGKESTIGAMKRRDLLHFLVDSGFTECYNYSLNEGSEGALALANPLLEDQTHFRTSLLPGLLENCRYNLQNDNRDAKYCELGHVVHVQESGAFEELISVAFLMPLESKEEHWEDFIKPTFFEAKNLLRHLWEQVTDQSFPAAVSSHNPLFQEGFAAQVGNLAQSIEGHVGYLNSELIKDLKMPIIAGELWVTLEAFERPLKRKQYRPFSYFPAAKRDIAVIVDREQPAQGVMDSVQVLAEKAAGDAFSDIEISLFDIYTGERIEQNKKSLAFNLTFRNIDKTPEDREIEQVFEKIVIALKEHPEFTLRA